MLGNRVRKHTEQDGTISEYSFGPSSLVSVNCRAWNGLGCLRFFYPLWTIAANHRVSAINSALLITTSPWITWVNCPGNCAMEGSGVTEWKIFFTCSISRHYCISLLCFRGFEFCHTTPFFFSCLNNKKWNNILRKAKLSKLNTVNLLTCRNQEIPHSCSTSTHTDPST